MFGNKKEKRFSIKHEESFEGGKIVIVVDTETGVHYISTIGIGATSFSPLLDENGQVVIDKQRIYYQFCSCYFTSCMKLLQKTA